MFQFHQNNSQLLFHVIVSPWGAGAFSRGFTKTLARQCRAFTRALKIEKLKAPLFPGPGGAGDANDSCIKGVYISRSCFPDVKRRGGGVRGGGEWGRMIDCIQPLTLADCSVSA